MASTLSALVVVALVATLVVLLSGVVVMTRGGEFNRKWGNKLMRARIAMQALAIALLFALFLLNRGWGD
ncbi:MAG: twin transmembrane helix small protein [Kiloniellales bacterium]